MNKNRQRCSYLNFNISSGKVFVCCEKAIWENLFKLLWIIEKAEEASVNFLKNFKFLKRFFEMKKTRLVFQDGIIFIS